MRFLGLVLLASCTQTGTIAPPPAELVTLPSDPTDPTDPTDPVSDPPNVVINEVVADNDSTLNGPDGYSVPDWVEIYNADDAPVDLDRLTLQNEDGVRWTGPAETQLLPGETFLVYAGEALDASPELWTGWPLNKDGDEVHLIFDVIHTLDVFEIDGDLSRSDVSWARIPDGSDTWQQTAWTTPGALNGDAVSPSLDVPDERFFRSDIVHQIHFTMGPIALDHINDSSRPEVPVEIEIDGIAYPEVGVKLKGSASYDTMDGKPAFVVDMNNFVPGTKYATLKKFKLHNGLILDPTRARDFINYKLSREAGVMAPRVGFAEVYANGVPYGIYIVIEGYDRTMIEYNHPGSGENGMIFEPNEPENGGFVWGDFGSTGGWDYETGPVPQDPEGMNSLNEADRIFSGPANDATVAELWTYVDKDNMLSYLAWEAIIGHTDGYQSPNNWRVYIDGQTKLVNFLPAGAEWTWDNWSGIWNSNGNAAEWCFDHPGCARDYAEKVIEIADLVDSLALQQEFLDISAFIDPAIQADPRYYISTWFGGGTIGSTRTETSDNMVAQPIWSRNEAYDRFPDLAP